uniref:Uncharacterized protein n=1 Tax=Oryza brachyantha TaxID=4533 RepID=J3LQH6_ORYBR
MPIRPGRHTCYLGFDITVMWLDSTRINDSTAATCNQVGDNKQSKELHQAVGVDATNIGMVVDADSKNFFCYQGNSAILPESQQQTRQLGVDPAWGLWELQPPYTLDAP